MSEKIGRPTKFTDEVKKKLYAAIRKGAPYEHACKYARVSVAKFYEWKAKGEKGIAPFADFLDELKQVEAETSLIWLDKIDKAMANGQWQAAAWKLERRYPEVYSQNAPLIARAEELKRILESKEIKERHNGQELDIRGN